MIEIKNKLPRVLSCFFEDSKHLRAHLYYRPVVLQLGSLPKDRQKIPFQPSINSGSLHWNDVVSFDDLLFRFLLDLRVFLTFTPLNEFKFTLDFWLPIHSPTQEIFRTEKYLEPMGSWFMGHQWLTLPRASNFLVKGLDRSRYVANLRKLTTLLKLTRLFVYNLREQGGGSATLQSVGRGCKRQSISSQDVAALQERNHQTIEKWDVQFGRTEQNRYDISLLFLKTSV